MKFIGAEVVSGTTSVACTKARKFEGDEAAERKAVDFALSVADGTSGLDLERFLRPPLRHPRDRARLHQPVGRAGRLDRLISASRHQRSSSSEATSRSKAPQRSAGARYGETVTWWTSPQGQGLRSAGYRRPGRCRP